MYCFDSNDRIQVHHCLCLFWSFCGWVHFNKDDSCGATMNSILSEACELVKACKSFGQHRTSSSLLVQTLTKSTAFHLFWTKFSTHQKCINNEGRDENTSTSCAVTGQTAMEKKLSPYKQNLLIKAVEMMLRKTTTWLGDVGLRKPGQSFNAGAFT